LIIKERWICKEKMWETGICSMEKVTDLIKNYRGKRCLICHLITGKKVLVTGHTGFKGAWLCAVLKQAEPR
jgi:FlaA1/EpsC-like NDP-sugar epimerase